MKINGWFSSRIWFDFCHKSRIQYLKYFSSPYEIFDFFLPYKCDSTESTSIFLHFRIPNDSEAARWGSTSLCPSLLRPEGNKSHAKLCRWRCHYVPGHKHMHMWLNIYIYIIYIYIIYIYIIYIYIIYIYIYCVFIYIYIHIHTYTCVLDLHRQTHINHISIRHNTYI